MVFVNKKHVSDGKNKGVFSRRRLSVHFSFIRILVSEI